jgi:hypothetical protein
MDRIVSLRCVSRCRTLSPGIDARRPWCRRAQNLKSAISLPNGVLGLISLDQDWLPLAMSVALVTVEHLVMGVVAPELLYTDPQAHVPPTDSKLCRGER